MKFQVTVRGQDRRGWFNLQTTLTADTAWEALTRTLTLWAIKTEDVGRVHVQLAEGREEDK